MLFDSCGAIYDHSPLQFKLHFSDIWLHFRRYICEILQLINIKVTEGAFGKFEQKLENHKSKKLMTLFYVGKLTHAFFIREKIILFLFLFPVIPRWISVGNEARAQHNFSTITYLKKFFAPCARKKLCYRNNLDLVSLWIPKV